MKKENIKSNVCQFMAKKCKNIHFIKPSQLHPRYLYDMIGNFQKIIIDHNGRGWGSPWWVKGHMIFEQVIF